MTGDRQAPVGQGRWYVLAAAILWGTTGTAQAFVPEEVTPAIVGATRLAIGGSALLALALWQGRFRRGSRWPAAPTASAAISIAAYQLCFFAGVARTGVAIGTMVTIGSAPVLAGILSLLVRHEQPGCRWVLTTALAVAGCGLLAAGAGGIRVDILGILAALGAGGAYATYAVASKNLLEEQHPEAVMAVVFCLGALLLAPVLFTEGLVWLAQPTGLFASLHLGLITTALAYILFARGLLTVSVATAVTLSLAEPLTAGILGVFLLGEHLNMTAGIGIALIFAGLAVLAVSRTPGEEGRSATP